MGVVVEVDQAGRISVKSNVPNVALALGLLEIAKAELLKQSQRPAEPGISVASAAATRHLLNGG